MQADEDRVEAWSPTDAPAKVGGRADVHTENTPIETFGTDTIDESPRATEQHATGDRTPEASDQPVARSLLSEFKESSLDADLELESEVLDQATPIKKATSIRTMLRKSLSVAEGAISTVRAGGQLDARMQTVNEKAKEETSEVYHSAENQRALRVLSRMRHKENCDQDREKAKTQRRTSIWRAAKVTSEAAAFFSAAGKEHQARKSFFANPKFNRRRAGSVSMQQNEYTDMSKQMEIDSLKQQMEVHVKADELVEAAKLSREIAALEGAAKRQQRASVESTKAPMMSYLTEPQQRASVVSTKAPRMSYLMRKSAASALSPSRIAPTPEAAPA